MKRYTVISIALLVGFVAGCAVPAHASTPCRTVNFASAAEQFHGESIITGKKALPADSTICDRGDGSAIWSYEIAGNRTEEVLTKQDDSLYTLVNRGQTNTAKTVIVFHFNNDGSFNYMKSYQGLGKLDGVSMAIGSWYF